MRVDGDYISREAAQKIICGWCGVCQNPTLHDLMHCDDICPQFAQIPAADVRPKWISVKERLPELHDAEYLNEVTGELIRYKESKPIMIWLEKGGFMDIGIYEKSDSVDDFCYQGVPATVTYWHPLPEPPKEAHDA